MFYVYYHDSVYIELTNYAFSWCIRDAREFDKDLVVYFWAYWMLGIVSRKYFFTMLNLDQFRFHSYQTSLSCYILKLGFQEAPKLLGPWCDSKSNDSFGTFWNGFKCARFTPSLILNRLIFQNKDFLRLRLIFSMFLDHVQTIFKGNILKSAPSSSAKKSYQSKILQSLWQRNLGQRKWFPNKKLLYSWSLLWGRGWWPTRIRSLPLQRWGFAQWKSQLLQAKPACGKFRSWEPQIWNTGCCVCWKSEQAPPAGALQDCCSALGGRPYESIDGVFDMSPLSFKSISFGPTPSLWPRKFPP